MNRRHPFQSACNSFWFSHFSPISEIEGLYDSQARSYGTAAMKIQRNPSFSKIEARDILHFQNILGKKNVIQDKDELAAANLDWMGKYGGSSERVLRPRNTEEVHTFNFLLLMSSLLHIITISARDIPDKICDILIHHYFEMSFHEISVEYVRCCIFSNIIFMYN
jgi:hypothetical protein